MTDVTQLEAWLRDLVALTPSYAAAFDKLLEAGAEAVPPTLAAVASGRAVARLTGVLATLATEPGGFDAVAAAVHDSRRAVAVAARAALGASGDPRALPVLVACLPRGRHVVAGALGDLGMAEAAPALRASLGDAATLTAEQVPSWLAEPRRRRELAYVAEVAQALAKLGDFELTPVIAALACPPAPAPRGAEDDRALSDAALRVAAVDALELSAAAGVAAALRTATADPSDEVAERALEALAGLGRARDLEVLVSVGSGRGPHAPLARELLARWAGAAVPGDLVAWSQRHLAPLDDRTCYRAGALATPGALVARLAGAPPPWLRSALKVCTGAPCVVDLFAGEPVTAHEARALARWWQVAEPTYPLGALHRWGRSYPATVVD